MNTDLIHCQNHWPSGPGITPGWGLPYGGYIYRAHVGVLPISGDMGVCFWSCCLFFILESSWLNFFVRTFVLWTFVLLLYMQHSLLLGIVLIRLCIYIAWRDMAQTLGIACDTPYGLRYPTVATYSEAKFTGTAGEHRQTGVAR